MNEYSMSWSDAIRAEADFPENQPVPGPPDDVHQFGTLGRALWRERSLAWILRLDPSVRAEEALKIVADLSSAFRPMEWEETGAWVRHEGSDGSLTSVAGPPGDV